MLSKTPLTLLWSPSRSQTYSPVSVASSYTPPSSLARVEVPASYGPVSGSTKNILLSHTMTPIANSRVNTQLALDHVKHFELFAEVEPFLHDFKAFTSRICYALPTVRSKSPHMLRHYEVLSEGLVVEPLENVEGFVVVSKFFGIEKDSATKIFRLLTDLRGLNEAMTSPPPMHLPSIIQLIAGLLQHRWVAHVDARS